MNKEESKYAKLGEQQKWEWHAEVYAFRHVVLARPIDEPTPCDEERRWYSEALVQAAVARKLAKRNEKMRYRDAGHSAMLEGRAAINAWARRKGHADIDAYAMAKGMDLISAYIVGMQEIVAEIVAAKGLKEPRHRRQPLDDIRRDLGLAATAREERPREFNPSPERLLADRQALGLESA